MGSLLGVKLRYTFGFMTCLSYTVHANGVPGYHLAQTIQYRKSVRDIGGKIYSDLGPLESIMGPGFSPFGGITPPALVIPTPTIPTTIATTSAPIVVLSKADNPTSPLPTFGNPVISPILSATLSSSPDNTLNPLQPLTPTAATHSTSPIQGELRTPSVTSNFLATSSIAAQDNQQNSAYSSYGTSGTVRSSTTDTPAANPSLSISSDSLSSVTSPTSTNSAISSPNAIYTQSTSHPPGNLSSGVVAIIAILSNILFLGAISLIALLSIKRIKTSQRSMMAYAFTTPPRTECATPISKGKISWTTRPVRPYRSDTLDSMYMVQSLTDSDASRESISAVPPAYRRYLAEEHDLWINESEISRWRGVSWGGGLNIRTLQDF